MNSRQLQLQQTGTRSELGTNWEKQREQRALQKVLLSQLEEELILSKEVKMHIFRRIFGSSYSPLCP